MMNVTAGQIQKIVDKTPLHVARQVADWLEESPQLSTRQRVSAFLAQLAFETSGLSCLQYVHIPALNHFWEYTNCNRLADANDFRAISRAFSSNLDGYGARLLIYKQALRVLKAH